MASLMINGKITYNRHLKIEEFVGGYGVYGFKKD